MSDEVKFLTARLDEDEQWARAGELGRRSRWPSDPLRTLREIEAKRAILALHEPLPSSYGEPSVCPSCWPQPWVGTHPLAPCPTMRHLVAVYSDHPDYRDEWKPSP